MGICFANTTKENVEMSNEKPTAPGSDGKTKLPAIDGNAVEEIPVGDLDSIAGGCEVTTVTTHTHTTRPTMCPFTTTMTE
jgi:hypothetical protein